MILPQPESARNTPIRVYPKIAAQAIKTGHALPYRLYTLIQARSAALSGRYIFTRGEIRAFAAGLLNDQQIDTALADGSGIFWTYSPEHRAYRMISRAKVAAAIGFTGNPGRCVEIPADAYRGRLADWKAAVYSAYLGQLYRNTPSREALCETFGVSIPTLLDWERRAKITVRPRIVLAEVAIEDDQAVAAAVSDEIDRSRSARTWLVVQGPRGKFIAGRRLMDNHNEPLPDYWSVQDEPAWEPGATVRFAWQATNAYNSPLNVAPSGRGSWLKAQIKRLSIPDKDATGSTESRPADYETRPAWHDTPEKLPKWRRRKQNQQRPTILAQFSKTRIVGQWQPSEVALRGN